MKQVTKKTWFEKILTSSVIDILSLEGCIWIVSNYGNKMR